MKLTNRLTRGDGARPYPSRQTIADLGGTPAGIKSSLKRMHPLGGLTDDEQARFLATLSEQDKELARRAIRYYNEVLLGQGKPSESTPATRP